MIQNLVVTVGAGLAGMLLFALSAKGTLAAVLVTWFTPLPIMIAALGWSQQIGLAAAVLGAAATAILLHPLLGLVYAIGFALPAWWLSYLVLLARFEAPAGDEAGEVRRSWYPIGRVVLWAALASAAAVILAVLAMIIDRGDFDTVARELAAQMAPLVEVMLGGRERLPPGVTPEALALVAILSLPVAAAGSLTLLHLTNLWLAGRTVQLSHRLPRPWPNLPEHLRLPPVATAALPLAIAVAFLTWVVWGQAGVFAMIVASALTTVFALQGLAVVHARARTVTGGRAILVAAYAAIVFLMPWPLLACVLLGFADAIFPLRNRPPAVS